MIGGVALAGVVIPAPAREADVNERTDTGTMDPHGRGDETPALTTCVRFTPSRPTPRHDQNPADFQAGMGRSRDCRDRRSPGPACAMRSQRDEIHPGSRRAIPARRNQPALDPRDPTSHNASPGDITNSTPPVPAPGSPTPERGR